MEKQIISAHSLRAQKVVVVMPAYNAEKTLHQTYEAMPHDLVHKIILVDDASHDETARVARGLGLETIVHDSNKGYGGNQKTCYSAALAADAGWSALQCEAGACRTTGCRGRAAAVHCDSCARAPGPARLPAAHRAARMGSAWC